MRNALKDFLRKSISCMAFAIHCKINASILMKASFRRIDAFILRAFLIV